MTKLESVKNIHWKSREIRADKEFLPGALELLETPASPIKIAFMMTICLLVIFVVAWGYLGHLDILAVAQGKIQPAGRVKVIQPLETGKVIAIHVANGSHVAARDILMELEPTDAVADEAGAAAAYASYLAEIERRRAAIKAAKTGGLTVLPPIVWMDNIPATMREREEEVLTGDIDQLAAQIADLDAQLAQKQAEKTRLLATIDSQQELVTTEQQRVDMRSQLMDKGAGSRASVIDAIETLDYQKTALVTQKGQVYETIASIAVLQQEKDKVIKTFISENWQKLADAARQRDDYEQRLAKARVKLAHMNLLSPVSGTVLALSVTTQGQVITSSEEVLRIVPDDVGLEVECYLQNTDVGFVHMGQSAVVKIEAFPFTRYGTVDAVVTNVAHDAIPEPDAQSIEGDPVKSTKSSYFAGAQRTQNLVFPVTLRLSRHFMDADGVNVPFSPGMSVSTEIKTGRRRILEYIFSPLVESVSNAMRER